MMILNEEKFARDLILGKNTSVKSTMGKIGYITRYNAQILNKNDNENYMSTIQWMQKHQDNFEESSYSCAISKAIKGAKKRPLYKIDNIVVTKNELNTIQSLNDIRQEKIVFVLLCMAKHQKYSIGFTDGLVKYNITELYKMARVSIPSEDREYVLNKLFKRGIVDSPKKNDTKCLYIKILDDNGDPELILNESDCQELAYAYLKWKNGKGFKRCKVCGRLIKSSRKKDVCIYCEQSKQDNKYIWCIDCGENVEIKNKDTRTCRCEKCKEIYDKRLKLEQNKRFYEASKFSRDQKNTIQN